MIVAQLLQLLKSPLFWFLFFIVCVLVGVMIAHFQYNMFVRSAVVGPDTPKESNVVMTAVLTPDDAV